MEEDVYKTGPGEDKAWSELASADPSAVVSGSLAVYDGKSGVFTLSILGERYRVDPGARKVENIDNPARPEEQLLGLAAPVYLAGARPVPPSGSLVKEFTGGEFFYRGAHTLPLDEIAGRYGEDCAGFGSACASELGGEDAGIGDCSCRFLVFPRVSMTLVLWLSDSEFPARASLLFDSNAGLHMPLDVLWAAALLSCRRLLRPAPGRMPRARR